MGNSFPLEDDFYIFSNLTAPQIFLKTQVLPKNARTCHHSVPPEFNTTFAI